MQKFKKISHFCTWATIFVIVCGLVSYLNANGHAAIGPDPSSVGAEKIAIAINTLWWAVFFGVAATFSLVISKRNMKA